MPRPVDIDLEATAIKALIKNLSYKRKGKAKMMGAVGHFAGLIDFGEMALALTTDGVGTKMLVADQQKDWSTVGIDCIAMNVNDLYVMNVEPIAFVDYIATDKLSIDKMAQIGIGLNEGAKQANIDIVGGETASLKGLVNGLDLAGTCLGMQKKDKIITGEKIKVGEKIIGVPSTGVHSNGLSLARRVVEKYAGYDKKFKGKKTFGQELLTPTRIYAESLKVAASCTVHGMCHVTGGGLLNFNRLSKYGFRFDTPITPPGNLRLDAEGRRYLCGRDVPHVQHGHGLCVCRAESERGVRAEDGARGAGGRGSGEGAGGVAWGDGDYVKNSIFLPEDSMNIIFKTDCVRYCPRSVLKKL